MRRFEGRVAFVTGAANGIGRGIAERLAHEGAAVVLADPETDTARQVALRLGEQGGATLVVPCDVTERASVDEAVARTIARFGRLDVLVNNAGGSVRIGDFEDTTAEGWHRQLDLTLVGAVRCIQAALPYLLPPAGGDSAGGDSGGGDSGGGDSGGGDSGPPRDGRDRPAGNVVNVASVNGLAAFGEPAYSAAKAGLVNLTGNLAARYARRGVRFNTVAPGTVRTSNWDDQPGALERLAELAPLGRVGEPADIAAAVAYLASDDAAWVTGTTLTVDGGVLVGPAGRRQG